MAIKDLLIGALKDVPADLHLIVYYLVQTYTRYRKETIREIIQEVRPEEIDTMMSQFAQDISSVARQEGLLEGEATRLLRMFSRRFQPLPDEITERVYRADPSFDRYFRRTKSFPSIETTIRRMIEIGKFRSIFALALISSLIIPPATAAPLYRSVTPYAGTDSSSTARALSTTQGPSEVLREGIGRLMSFLEEDGVNNPFRLKTFLEHEVSPYFNFSYMTRWAAGSRYRYMDQMQRKNMRDSLKGMFMGSMLRHLSDYRDAKIRHLTPRKNRMGGVVLGIRIQQGKTQRRLEFHLFQSKNDWNADGLKTKSWMIADVVLDGQSALAYYRRYFSRIDSSRAESRK
uniref:ABC-type transporter Mla maintaining outer membrane lipid asymmetry, MlaC component n=1 Tax=Candidatus Kentrum sp. TUN TaxID=2126343 RepID=A0A451A978_9GAMM|nr:MAG: ABC-type transporter Mla maintaining outer membrane lipid asymmetry, MlaC component [Candidatus Kentron sp. TUN]VFK71848.1 MAG: ABC-type transporter Mla maintaining outer membrane lipid asymmetry, MlaC component [Candidatus Kentron sp. TUN]